MSKKHIVEWKQLNETSIISKLLLKFLMGGKVKTVSSKNKQFTSTLQDIGIAMNRLQKVIDEYPELEKALKKRFGV